MERIAKLKAFLDESPDDNFLNHALALEYIKIGEDDKARQLFEAILARDENYVGSYYHLARLLEKNGKNEEALKVFEKGMERAKANNDSHAYNELKSAWEELSDW